MQQEFCGSSTSKRTSVFTPNVLAAWTFNFLNLFRGGSSKCPLTKNVTRSKKCDPCTPSVSSRWNSSPLVQFLSLSICPKSQLSFPFSCDLACLNLDSGNLHKCDMFDCLMFFCHCPQTIFNEDQGNHLDKLYFQLPCWRTKMSRTRILFGTLGNMLCCQKCCRETKVTMCTHPFVFPACIHKWHDTATKN